MRCLVKDREFCRMIVLDHYQVGPFFFWGPYQVGPYRARQQTNLSKHTLDTLLWIIFIIFITKICQRTRDFFNDVIV